MKVSRIFAALAVVGITVTTIIPATASAQTAPANKKAACIAKQSTVKDVNKLKQTGNSWIENRKKSMDKFNDSSLNEKYQKQDQRYTKAKRSADRVTKKELAVQKPANNKGKISDVREAFSNALDAKKGALNAATTPAAAATVNCEVMWDLRIASYIAPKLKAQLALDEYANTNAINTALYEVAKTSNKVEGIKNPAETANQITATQAKLDTITFSTDGGQIVVQPLQTSGAALFNPVKEDSLKISKELKATSSSLNRSVSQINREQTNQAREQARANQPKNQPKAPKAPASADIKAKAEANRQAAPNACKDQKGSGKTASDKDAKAACEYGYRTTGQLAKRQEACKNKFSKKNDDKSRLLTTACNAGIELRSS